MLFPSNEKPRQTNCDRFKIALPFEMEFSGLTNLPYQIVQTVLRKKGHIIDINVNTSPFSEIALRNQGLFLQYPSEVILPKLIDLLN